MSTPTLADRLGVSTHTVQRWVAEGVVVPTTVGRGPGRFHKWSFEDLSDMRVMVRLHDVIDDFDILRTVWRALQVATANDDIIVIAGEQVWVMPYADLPRVQAQGVWTIVKLALR